MEILKYPHPSLKIRCRDVKRIDRASIDRVAEMFKAMYEHRGVGLAAPQVGWNARLFVVNVTGEKDDEMVFVNPVIVGAEGSVNEEEGCLSVPGVTGRVRRAEHVRVKAFDLDGRELGIEGEGVLAIAFQHETDHLNGTLFVSKLSSAGKMAVAAKLKDLEERFKAAHPDMATSCPM